MGTSSSSFFVRVVAAVESSSIISVLLPNAEVERLRLVAAETQSQKSFVRVSPLPVQKLVSVPYHSVRLHDSNRFVDRNGVDSNNLMKRLPFEQQRVAVVFAEVAT